MQGWDPCFSPWFFSSTSFFLGGGGWRRKLQGIYMAVLLRRKIVYRPFKIEESGTVQIFFLSLVAIDARKTWKKRKKKPRCVSLFFTCGHRRPQDLKKKKEKTQVRITFFIFDGSVADYPGVQTAFWSEVVTAVSYSWYLLTCTCFFHVCFTLFYCCSAVSVLRGHLLTCF